MDTPGIPYRNVVAVVAALPDGREQVGSGYLLDGHRVVTAAHCVRDKATGRPVPGLRVVRATSGTSVPVAEFVASDVMDVAVLDLADEVGDVRPVTFARVDRTSSGVLDDCVAIGFPLFQRDPATRHRHTAELHGVIYQTDEAETGLLLLREPMMTSVRLPDGADRAAGTSVWGGLSGAVVFHDGLAIGVVIEHHPRQGGSAVRVLPFHLIAVTAAADQATTAIATRLGLLDGGTMPLAGGTDVVADMGFAIRSLTDPVEFEVHPAITVAGRTDLPVLPEYVPRPHDDEVDDVLREAADGARMLVFVGGSSTGKTRSAWEAVHRLPDGWALWHPIEPSRPAAVLDGLKAGVPPRTVLWLNELQLYLNPSEVELGERVAAAVRDLLRTKADTPLLVIGTLWPEHWLTLTAGPESPWSDRHNQARNLLRGATEIRVPETFADAVDALRSAAVSDPRLDLALREGHGRVAQYLAGVRELIARYNNATAAQLAVMAVAADADRIGHVAWVSEQWLVDAAEGYLSDDDWHRFGDRWPHEALEALRDLSRPRMGVRGPLSRVRGREPVYELADYLARSIINHRRFACPPEAFWDAVPRHVDSPPVLTLIAAAAAQRARYRHAATLYRLAVAHGHAPAIAGLAGLYVRTGRWPAAVETYRQAIDQGQLWAIAELATLYEHLGDPAQVAHLAQWALDVVSPVTVAGAASRYPRPSGDRPWQQPLTHQFIVDIAAQRLAAGDTAGAAQLYRLLADAGHGPALIDLMLMSERAGDHAGTERFAEELAAAPGFRHLVPTISDLADTRTRDGDRAGAVRLYRISATTGDVGATAELAALHLLADDTAGAQELIDNSANHGEVELLAMAASLREELRARPARRAPATEVTAPATTVTPEEQRAAEQGLRSANLSLLMARLGDARTGDLHILQKVVESSPDDAELRDVLFTRLRAAAATGDVSALTRIVLLDPSDRGRLDLLVHQHLGELEFTTVVEIAESQGAAGHPDVAIELYHRLVDAGHPDAIDNLARWLEHSGRRAHAKAVRHNGLTANGAEAAPY